MKHTPWTLEHYDPIGMDELYFLFVYEGEDIVCRISADTSEDCLERAKLIAAAPDLLKACGCALADLEGIMPIHEPDSDRIHPAWTTIKELMQAIAKAEGR